MFFMNGLPFCHSSRSIYITYHLDETVWRIHSAADSMNQSISQTNKVHSDERQNYQDESGKNLNGTWQLAHMAKKNTRLQLNSEILVEFAEN